MRIESSLELAGKKKRTETEQRKAQEQMEDSLFNWELWLLQFTRTLEIVNESLKPVWWFDHINGAYTKEKNLRIIHFAKMERK